LSKEGKGSEKRLMNKYRMVWIITVYPWGVTGSSSISCCYEWTVNESNEENEVTKREGNVEGIGGKRRS
jgi:hypothetical protein